MNETPSSPELLSLVLTLQPLEAPPSERAMPGWWGRAGHALLLELVDRSNPDLAERLHNEGGLRPFTASTLIGRMNARRPDPQRAYTLRLTALTRELSALLLAAVQPEDILQLDYLPFRVLSAACSAEAHPWAARESFAGLTAGRLVGEDAGERSERKIGLRFSSPTGFHSAGKHQPLPLPEQVFGSLLERWNAFAPLAFPDEVKRYAAECLAVSRFELRSAAVPVKEGGLRVGAVGEVVYTAVTYDRYWMGVLRALAAYAQFSGVGAGTSFGFGQSAAL